MTTLHEAAQQALEALYQAREFSELYDTEQSAAVNEQCHETITALRAALAEDAMQKFSDVNQELEAALAEPVQEPVAWGGDPSVQDYSSCYPKPVQEPVAKVELMTTGGNAGLATRIVEIDDHLRERLRPGQLLYTTPPQRPLLTDEEIDRITDAQWASNNHKPIYAAHRAYARAIERAHGIGGQHEP